LNLFDIHAANPSEHFLRQMILSLLAAEGKHKSKESFVSSISIVGEMQEWGFPVSPTEAALRELNKN